MPWLMSFASAMPGCNQLEYKRNAEAVSQNSHGYGSTHRKGTSQQKYHAYPGEKMITNKADSARQRRTTLFPSRTGPQKAPAPAARHANITDARNKR